jgi:hypothetical protein
MTQHTNRVLLASRVTGSRVQASGFHRSSLARRKSTGTVGNHHWNRRSSALCTSRRVASFGSRLSLDLSVSQSRSTLSQHVWRRGREKWGGAAVMCGRTERRRRERGRKGKEKGEGERQWRAWEKRGEKEKKKRKRKRKKIGDTWRAASGWKGMMKSSSANRAMTHGKREITLFLKPPNYIN